MRSIGLVGNGSFLGTAVVRWLRYGSPVEVALPVTRILEGE